MIDTEKLEDAIKTSGLKKGFIAERLGLSRGGFTNCLQGKSEFRVGQIRTLCELLRLNHDQINAIFFTASGG